MAKGFDISLTSIWSIIKIVLMVVTVAGGIAVLVWMWNKIKGLPGQLNSLLPNIGRQATINEAVQGGVNPDQVQQIFDTLDNDLIRASVWKANMFTSWYGQILEDNAYAKAKKSLSELKAALGI